MQPLLVGDFNQLKVLSSSPEGFELEGGVWLEKREVKEDVYAGRTLEVFVYSGAKGDLFATQFRPLLRVGDLGYLKVSAIQEVGAFVDWGLHKELFLPFREQTRDLKVGDWVSVFVFLDEDGRVAASMKVEAFLHPEGPGYRDGDDVNLYILARTPLGFKAVVDQATVGVLYQNEVFQPLSEGQSLTGFIKKVREDGKLDLTLQRPGYQDCDQTAQKILASLKKEGGHLDVGDKSSTETIYSMFGVSKKKFKMALGSLYKKRLIRLEGENSIRLS